MARYRCKSKIIGTSNPNDLSFLALIKNLVNVCNPPIRWDQLIHINTVPTGLDTLLFDANPTRRAIFIWSTAGSANLQLNVRGPMGNVLRLIEFSSAVWTPFTYQNYGDLLPLEWIYNDLGITGDFFAGAIYS